MPNVPPGLHESLVTEALAAELLRLGPRCHTEKEGLHAAEAPDRIAFHVASILRRVVASLGEEGRVAGGMHLSRVLLKQLQDQVSTADLSGDVPIDPGTVLRAVIARLPDGEPEPIRRPLIPLLDTALLTNAPGEPRVGAQLETEIESADRIDVVMAFIRLSGLRPFLAALERHCQRGRPLRFLTTTYTGTTQLEALERLQSLGAEVRVSYNTSTTRLHAKSWLFHRSSGFSTAYIGSSNLTHSAQITGLEWNLRIAGARDPDVLEKMRAVIDSYWNSPDFVPFERQQFTQFTSSEPSTRTRMLLSPLELRPEPFQERLLDQIAMARAHGHHRNLLAAATGTGKTVMAAVDYVRLRHRMPSSRLLFVAHRQELLEASLATFRHAVRDPVFGELWVGGQRPERFDHVFASIQSLSASGLDNLQPTHFDIVVIDEFHHAAAPSYRALLTHIQPRELLGLTATPERSDGLPVLAWFDNRIAAELRLWDAVAQQRLCPFAYFGISDGLDLRAIPWRRGRGYDTTELSNVMTGNGVWARLVITQLQRHVDDCSKMRALGFCVGVEHARYMAQTFTDAGIPAVAIWGESDEAERRAALTDLMNRRVNCVFSVDLFNEGIDVPVVDTLLFLRPTDSPTLFLQQLGRGLRRADAEGKTICTVLDFVGQHRREFRFDRRFGALLGGTRKELEEQVRNGFPLLPAGCHMQLDAVARNRVLQNLRESIPTGFTARVDELQSLVRTGKEPTLEAYLEHTGRDLSDVYEGQKTWSELREAANLPVAAPGPKHAELRRGCARLLHVDDRLRLETWLRWLKHGATPNVAGLAPVERRLLRMLVGQLALKALPKVTSLQEGLNFVWGNRQIVEELRELLPLLVGNIDHIHHALADRHDVPLRVHARYKRVEIFAAFDIGEGALVPTWQTGVHWDERSRADLFAITLDKTSGRFSPTTRYRDYAISRELIHWESQAATRADSETGRRYQNHVALGSSVMLFTRLREKDAFWFLGPATYQSHQSERPMAVTWRLHHPLPADLFTAFAAAVA